ncbi:Vesicle-associated protein 1-3 [Apostasia shenzhenica]|uniref:Vesicle-associated protein 1-3 n=1 Tax=Apostasia shenzhenica TaxID=1088818 RepID=A0A2I0A644_9ASPA|nr:Vesicle-associated protein 1-3 [Apostasia shenzhenica]
MSELVEIEPRELKFTFKLKKQSSCLVRLSNKTDEYVAFKVKTTSPKRYCVRPNTGIIQPLSACNFIVTMQAQRTAPPDMQLKDKFLVQSTAVPNGTIDADIFPTFFSKENDRYIEECKLRVVLESSVVKDSPASEEPLVARESLVKDCLLVKESHIVKEVPSVRVELLDDQPINLIHAEDVTDLRSMISRLELKLTEVDGMITILREEKSRAIQERDRLQHEIIPLRGKAAAKGQAGFPPSFVVFIWIVGIALGFLLLP